MHSPDKQAEQAPAQKSDKQGRKAGNDERGTHGSSQEQNKPLPSDAATPSDKQPGRKGDQPA